jgi:glutaredoxin 3
MEGGGGFQEPAASLVRYRFRCGFPTSGPVPTPRMRPPHPNHQRLSMIANVKVYTTQVCPYCIRAKALLKKRDVPYEEIDVSKDEDKRAWLVSATGMRTVPQIFIDEKPIGGSDELHALDASGELERMLHR